MCGRFYKHWYTSKKKAFTRYAKKFAEAPQEIDAELARIKQYAQVVRVIAHTQVCMCACVRSYLKPSRSCLTTQKRNLSVSRCFPML